MLLQGRSFAKQVVGAEPVKTAQSTVKIIEFQISLRIWHTFSLKLGNLGLFWLKLWGLKPPQLNTKLHPCAALRSLIVYPRPPLIETASENGCFRWIFLFFLTHVNGERIYPFLNFRNFCAHVNGERIYPFKVSNFCVHVYGERIYPFKNFRISVLMYTGSDAVVVSQRNSPERLWKVIRENR